MGIMEKKILLGVQKKRVAINKRNKKKLLLKKVVNYLKSDSYFFAPLTSSSSSSSSSSRSDLHSLKTVEMKEKAKENDNRLLNKVGDYLMSDSYMYAPLVVPSKSLVSPLKGPQRYIKRVTVEVSRSSITLKDKNEFASKVVEGQASKDHHLHEKMVPDRPSLVHKEKMKQMTYHKYCRSSMSDQKGMLGSQISKVV
ncbi:hypothetical protein PanWU01x14_184030 [Parasponia andersonii]|uniref:Uncharacterized protein n=1 Tax=Parasponia andersonii TaxID=3476 RepID=A0A2P5C4Y0_PARAD|nr:hypothetical protein PanWU01x14_184030 [Parasponia andersonii]